MTTRAHLTAAQQMFAGAGYLSGATPVGRRGALLSHVYAHNFGAVATVDPDGIVDGESVSDSVTTTLTLALTTLDVPRNITVVGDADVDGDVTITGADVHGQTMVEVLTANGATPVVGLKAFATLTSITVSACTAGDTIDVGFGAKLGLPYALASKANILSSTADGSVEDFTLVVADADQDATAGDARGTVTPTTSANGTVEFSVLMFLPDTSTREALFGESQYSG